MFGAEGSIGRFDQWMYPFCKSDIDRGSLTIEEAQELLECLWIKINHFASSSRGNNDSLRNMTLAGQTSGGEDACNELTYMCLEASATLKLPEPKLNVRFFDGSPRTLLLECCHMLADGINVIAIYNDEVVVPGMSRLGIPIEDIREYCNDGCSELVIGGKSTLSFKSNYSLEPLRDTVLNAQHRQYETFDEVMADFKARLVQYIPEEPFDIEGVTYPYFAASIEDCLDKASPKGARYQIKGTIMAQIGNSADGLAAIKKLIYDDGSLTWHELVSAIKADYAGHELLRQKLLHYTPKFGNDDDYIDAIAKEIAEYFCDCVDDRACNANGNPNKLAAGLMCFGIHHRKDQLATPDGRRQGDLTASSFSPSIGMDKSCPTAVLKSVAKVDLTKAANGSVLDMAMHTSAVKGEAAFKKFVDLIESFLTLRCTATLQMNVIDRDTLLKARADPNNPEYRTLIVRVWGFSAVFVELHPDLQDHVIARTEHAL
jgi:pyruvate-formate lyase